MPRLLRKHDWLERFGARTIVLQRNNRLAKIVIVFLLSYLGIVTGCVYAYGRTHRALPCKETRWVPVGDHAWVQHTEACR